MTNTKFCGGALMIEWSLAHFLMWEVDDDSFVFFVSRLPNKTFATKMLRLWSCGTARLLRSRHCQLSTLPNFIMKFDKYLMSDMSESTLKNFPCYLGDDLCRFTGFPCHPALFCDRIETKAKKSCFAEVPLAFPTHVEYKFMSSENWAAEQH
jgi:hypothetical protein